jgi:hypothetical protein
MNESEYIKQLLESYGLELDYVRGHQESFIFTEPGVKAVGSNLGLKGERVLFVGNVFTSCKITFAGAETKDLTIDYLTITPVAIERVSVPRSLAKGLLTKDLENNHLGAFTNYGMMLNNVRLWADAGSPANFGVVVYLNGFLYKCK